MDDRHVDPNGRRRNKRALAEPGFQEGANAPPAFSKCRSSARGDMERYDGTNGDLEIASRGTPYRSQAESGWGRASGSRRPWRRTARRLRLPDGFLQLLEALSWAR